MRIFGGMEHLTPRRSGRSKNDAAAGATDRKKEGRGVKEGMEQSLVFVLRRQTGIFSCLRNFTWFIFSVVSGASRNFHPLRASFPSFAIPSPASLVLLDFYGDNPPTRDRATDTCFVRRRRTLPRVSLSALRRGIATIITRKLTCHFLSYRNKGENDRIGQLIIHVTYDRIDNLLSDAK